MDLHARRGLHMIRLEKGRHQRLRKKGECKGKKPEKHPSGAEAPLILQGLCTG
jgi:hypothetical protein